MNVETVETLATLAAHLSASGMRPQLAARAAVDLHACARRAQALAERDCNTGGEHPRQWARIESDIRAAIADAPAGIGFTLGGDPRGYVLKLTGLPSNCFSGEGFGIPPR